jgi:hypothetical protein
MKRSSEDYGKIARIDFLRGTKFRTPVEAVESGARSIEDWCDCLAAHRQKYSSDDVRRSAPGPQVAGD